MYTVVQLQGPVSVAYKRKGRKDWYATALQFDLVGHGSSKEQALRELQDVVADYLVEITEVEGPVQFFNPSPPEEWNLPDKQHFVVNFVVHGPVTVEVGGRTIAPGNLNRLRDRIQNVDLMPVYA